MTNSAEITQEHVQKLMMEDGFGPEDVLNHANKYAAAITGTSPSRTAAARIRAIARGMIAEALKRPSGDSTARYAVLQRCDMGDGSEIVLCDRGEGTPQQFVVWTRSIEEGFTYCGHYFDSLRDALTLLEEKAGRVL